VKLQSPDFVFYTLVKNIVLTGFGKITLLDLDTIDISNLNRQFLFKKKDVKQSKAMVRTPDSFLRHSFEAWLDCSGCLIRSQRKRLDLSTRMSKSTQYTIISRNLSTTFSGSNNLISF